jgi:hypothetical protein
MTKFKTQNGWTKERMIAQIRKYNNGTRAIDVYGECKYQDHNGNRCAVGCFLPDGHEGFNTTVNVYNLLRKFPDLNDIVPIKHMALSIMQGVHDECDTGDVRDLLEAWINNNVEDA